jgi:membrane protease YdiL (CAAX protease family)
MNNYYDFSGGGGYHSPEPDYYDRYTTDKLHEARGVFSRYHLSLFLYQLIPSILVIAAQIVMIFVMGAKKASEFLDNNIYLQWLLGVGPMYLIGLPILFFLVREMKTQPREKKPIKISEFFELFVISYAAMTVGELIGNGINSFIGSIFQIEPTNTTSELVEKSPIWLIILVTVVLAPLVEELLFRKLMIDRLSRYGDGVAITVSAISFGLFHGNLYQFFYAAMIGFILGYIYTRTGNVLYTVLMHMIINFICSVAVMPVIGASEKLIEMSESMANGETVKLGEYFRYLMTVASYSIIEYGLMFAGIILFVLYIRKRKVKLSGNLEYKIPREKTFSTVALNVGTIIFIVYALINFGVGIFNA